MSDNLGDIPFTCTRIKTQWCFSCGYIFANFIGFSIIITFAWIQFGQIRAKISENETHKMSLAVATEVATQL